MTATIKGEASLLRKLTIIPERMKAQIRIVMAQHADEVTDMMRRLAPPHIVSSIGWRWGASAPTGTRVVGRAAMQGLTISIYAKEWTAAWFEFGTAERFHKSGKSVGAITAQPFFYVSWRASRKDAKNKIRAAVRNAAKQVAAGG